MKKNMNDFKVLLNFLIMMIVVLCFIYLGLVRNMRKEMYNLIEFVGTEYGYVVSMVVVCICLIFLFIMEDMEYAYLHKIFDKISKKML